MSEQYRPNPAEQAPRSTEGAKKKEVKVVFKGSKDSAEAAEQAAVIAAAREQLKQERLAAKKAELEAMMDEAEPGVILEENDGAPLILQREAPAEDPEAKRARLAAKRKELEERANAAWKESNRIAKEIVGEEDFDHQIYEQVTEQDVETSRPKNNPDADMSQERRWKVAKDIIDRQLKVPGSSLESLRSAAMGELEVLREELVDLEAEAAENNEEQQDKLQERTISEKRSKILELEDRLSILEERIDSKEQAA